MEDEIVMEMDIAAPPERVFRALTDPQQLLAWWSDKDKGGSTHWELDLRVGGKWRAEGKDESCGEWEMNGEVLEAVGEGAKLYPANFQRWRRVHTTHRSLPDL
jgi:uncharacterized protein YndB with AHSA1/START domain